VSSNFEVTLAGLFFYGQIYISVHRVLALTPSVLRDSGSPLRSEAPLLVGVSLGTLIVVFAHVSLG